MVSVFAELLNHCLGAEMQHFVVNGHESSRILSKPADKERDKSIDGTTKSHFN